MSLLTIGSIVIIAVALFSVKISRQIIVSKQVLFFVNFIIFTSAVAIECVFIMGVLEKVGKWPDDYYTYHSNPLVARLFPLYGSKRYDPFLYSGLDREKVKERVKELDILKGEGKISQEVYDKAIADAVGEKVK